MNQESLFHEALACATRRVRSSFLDHVYEKALADYRATADLNPTDAQLCMSCAILRARLGDTAGYQSDRELAIKIDPQLQDAPPKALPRDDAPAKCPAAGCAEEPSLFENAGG